MRSNLLQGSAHSSIQSQAYGNLHQDGQINMRDFSQAHGNLHQDGQMNMKRDFNDQGFSQARDFQPKGAYGVQTQAYGNPRQDGQMNMRDNFNRQDFSQDGQQVQPELQDGQEVQPEVQDEQVVNLEEDVEEGEANGDLEGRLDAAASHAKSMELAARRWTDRSGALVDANRIELHDDHVNEAVKALLAFLKKMPPSFELVNAQLHGLQGSRKELHRLLSLGGMADPHMKQRVLEAIPSHADATTSRLQAAVHLGEHAAEITDQALSQSRLAPPLLVEDDVHVFPVHQEETGGEGAEGPDGEPETDWAKAQEQISLKDEAIPIGATSAGCSCDSKVKCGLQGRSFTWCRVGGGHCRLLRHDNHDLRDPGGADHHLYKSTQYATASGVPLERSGAVWDYCMAKPSPQPSGSAPRTAHQGTCAWRSDLLKRYR